MPSFSTTYTCEACGTSSNVEVIDLGDPYRHISEGSQDAMRRVRETQNKLGQEKPGDPVEELAHELLEQEARSELRYATCPKCSVKNPEGLAAIRAERRQNLLFGIVFFGIIAAIAWFYPWAALILPGMDLLVFRPMMIFHVKKSGKPFPIVPFASGVFLDALLIALIVLYPRAAPFVPIAGIVQSLFGGSTKHDWKWDEAKKKLRFEMTETAAAS
jgi:hypothetical protein